MKYFLFFLTLNFIGFHSSLKAQCEKQVSLSGQVVDFETKESLIGATVFIKDTKIGCSADINGYFSFTYCYSGDVEDLTDVVVIAFIGFESLHIPVKDMILNRVPIQSSKNSKENRQRKGPFWRRR